MVRYTTFSDTIKINFRNPHTTSVLQKGKNFIFSVFLRNVPENPLWYQIKDYLCEVTFNHYA